MKPTKNNVKIENCDFSAVKWEPEAIEAIKLVAQALLEQARACQKITDVFSNANVKVETMLRIGGDDGPKGAA